MFKGDINRIFLFERCHIDKQIHNQGKQKPKKLINKSNNKETDKQKRKQKKYINKSNSNRSTK